MVRSLARDLEAPASISRDYHLERLRRVALYWSPGQPTVGILFPTFTHRLSITSSRMCLLLTLYFLFLSGDDGNSKWVYGFPHNAFLDMAVPFIAAYKEGASDPAPYIKDDKM
jgi:hypothetical protein